MQRGGWSPLYFAACTMYVHRYNTQDPLKQNCNKLLILKVYYALFGHLILKVFKCIAWNLIKKYMQIVTDVMSIP